jgi:histone H3/H4
LADQGARERWQGMAAEEVQKAVTSLLAEPLSRIIAQGTSSVA